jgi:hypothetical protein
MTYLPNNPNVNKHDTAASQQCDGSFLPVWCVCCGVEEDAPESPQHHRPDVHRVQCYAAHGIVTATLQDDVRPAKDQWVDHVSCTSQVESEESSCERQTLHKKHRADNNLQKASQDGHGDALSSCVHVPGGEHVCQDTDSLDADGVSVDLSLCEGGLVILEPE